MTNTNTASGAAEIAATICKSVAELPDRDSPADWPDAMLVTHDELSQIVIAALASAAAPAPQPNTAYAALPMQFACSGVHPVYSADQMRAFADGTHALRTQHIVCREFLERMLSAMEGVIDVADRQTDEFEALRSCVVDLTLMLFKPEALRASRGQAPALHAVQWQCGPQANGFTAPQADSVLEGAVLLKEARDALWQPANVALCERIDAYLDAASKQGANHD